MSSTTQESEQTHTESSISNLLVLKPLRDPCKPTTENSRLLVWSLGTFQPFAPRFSAVTTRVANPWPAQCQTNLGCSCFAKQRDPISQWYVTRPYLEGNKPFHQCADITNINCTTINNNYLEFFLYFFCTFLRPRLKLHIILIKY